MIQFTQEPKTKQQKQNKKQQQRYSEIGQKFIPLQDKIARIRKRKRGRNMLNRSGNTTDNLCFRYRFRE